MDLGDETELDFEEDLPESDSRNVSEEFENAEEEKLEDPDINGTDHYLQIDCPEEEEDFLSKIASDTEKVENHENGTEPDVTTKDPADEVNEKVEKKDEYECEKNGKKKNWKNRNSKKMNTRNNGRERPFGVPLYGSSGSLRSNRWRPANNFTRLSRQNVGQRSTFVKGLPLRYPPKLHHFSQNYLQNQNEFVSILGLSASQNQTMHQINNLFSQYSAPMLDFRKNFIRNGVLGQCCNAILNQIQFSDFSRCKGVLQQKLAADADSKNLPVENLNGFKSNYNKRKFNNLCGKEQIADREEDLHKSRKEARLIRFKNDQTSKNEVKQSEYMPEKPVIANLSFEDDYFRKMEEQKRKRQEIFSLKEKNSQYNENSTSDKMGINKELLLRKENPFEKNLQIAGSNIKVELRQEKWEENVTVKRNGSPLSKELCFVKQEVKSPVKFIRTVLKSFEELGLNKTKSEFLSRINIDELDTCPDCDPHMNKFQKVTLVDTASQTQAEPHLTGCIVKVLNIPPSTTADDILALCTPFGIVMEVKLNFPKENSVAIRFAEPKSAVNFFNLYNGRVIDSHTLNVITV